MCVCQANMCVSHTVSIESVYLGSLKEVVVLSVIIGQEKEVVGVRTCLTWKPLSVLTLMGRPKQRRLGALSLPPSTPRYPAQPWP